MESVSDEKIYACANGIASALTDVQPGKLDPQVCSSPVQIGFFFDGTQNNKERDKKSNSHSNIARLFDIYPNRRDAGYYRIYVPGVGTVFREIGDTDESSSGSAFGIGCEARVLYALLQLINSIQSVAIGRPFFTPAEVKELCKAPEFLTYDSDEKKQLHDEAGGKAFLSSKVSALEEKLVTANGRRISECTVDVFGFSRGAAEARVFCSWIANLVHDKKFAGIPIKIRFLGIFDTVASAGFWNAVANVSTTDGHSGWASPTFLRVSSLVENCTHFIAMHELRKNFPLDQITVNGKLRKGFIEVVFPGSHSDVGGGYAPGELGISVAGDSQKLSQIALNHMFKCAVAAGVPLSKQSFDGQKLELSQYEISPKLKEAFEGFLRESGTEAKSMREWMQPYLNWRWQVRKTFSDTRQVTLANTSDKNLLISCNAKLLEDAELLIKQGNVKRAREYVQSVAARKMGAEPRRHYRANEDKIIHCDEEAPFVLEEAMSAPKVSAPLAEFFDSYVHDSYAGFSKSIKEATGYWRYRKIFSGDKKPTF